LFSASGACFAGARLFGASTFTPSTTPITIIASISFFTELKFDFFCLAIPEFDEEHKQHYKYPDDEKG